MNPPKKICGEEYYTIDEKLEICSRNILNIINNHRRYYQSFERLDKCMVDYLYRLLRETKETLWQVLGRSRHIAEFNNATTDLKNIESYGKAVIFCHEQYLANDRCVELYNESMEALFMFVQMMRERYPQFPRISLEHYHYEG